MTRTGETIGLLYSELDSSGPAHAALVLSRGAPGLMPRIQYLVRPRENELVARPALAVRADGTAAVTWVGERVGPGGATTARAMLATASPGAPFAHPQPVTGLAPVAFGTAVSFAQDGALNLAWTMTKASEDIRTLEDPRASGVFAAVGEPGAHDSLAGEGPRVTLRVKPLQNGEHHVVVTVRVDRPCLVRVGTLAAKPSRYSSSRNSSAGSDPSHEFTAPGSARLRVGVALPESKRGHVGTITFVAYASTPVGASSVAKIRARLVEPRFVDSLLPAR